MAVKAIKAVIFDMDGLMLDSQKIAFEAWRTAAADHGFDLSDELNLSLAGRSDRDSVKILRSAFGPEFPLEKIRGRARALFFDYANNIGIPVKDGLMEILNFLDKKNIETAVATSTEREECIDVLEKSGLVHRFKVIVCGDEIDKAKPEPDIFLRTSNLLYARPDECIVLEDSTAGIQAAHAAGMITIMVPDLQEPTEETISMVYSVVSSLHEAILEIENILSGRNTD